MDDNDNKSRDFDNPEVGQIIMSPEDALVHSENGNEEEIGLTEPLEPTITRSMQDTLVLDTNKDGYSLPPRYDIPPESFVILNQNETENEIKTDAVTENKENSSKQVPEVPKRIQKKPKIRKSGQNSIKAIDKHNDPIYSDGNYYRYKSSRKIFAKVQKNNISTGYKINYSKFATIAASIIIISALALGLAVGSYKLYVNINPQDYFSIFQDKLVSAIVKQTTESEDTVLLAMAPKNHADKEEHPEVNHNRNIRPEIKPANITSNPGKSHAKGTTLTDEKVSEPVPEPSKLQPKYSELPIGMDKSNQPLKQKGYLDQNKGGENSHGSPMKSRTGEDSDSGKNHKALQQDDIDNEGYRSLAYVVRSGDSLWKILNKKGLWKKGRVRDFIQVIKKLNPSWDNLDLIHPGDRILLPIRMASLQDNLAGKDSSSSDTPRTKKTKNVEFTDYRVKLGDNLERVARKLFNIPKEHLYNEYLELILLLNPTLKNLNSIFPGQLIRLPVYPSEIFTGPIIISGANSDFTSTLLFRNDKQIPESKVPGLSAFDGIV